jgi:hypothetical protein
MNQIWTLIADPVLTGSVIDLWNLAHIYALILCDHLLFWFGFHEPNFCGDNFEGKQKLQIVNFDST